MNFNDKTKKIVCAVLAAALILPIVVVAVSILAV